MADIVMVRYDSSKINCSTYVKTRKVQQEYAVKKVVLVAVGGMFECIWGRVCFKFATSRPT
jgi:hypothetical protein